MADRDWNDHYASGEIPWESDEPDPALVAMVESGEVAPGRALDIGCGTGVHALWLASRGFDVLGVDLAPLAIEQARARQGDATGCRFEVLDFLEDELPAPVDFVFDRGCFHVFDDAAVRERFAARVARVLAPGGTWLSLLGSTEGGPREFGPPRRSARDIVSAIEPVLEIVALRSILFDLDVEEPPAAWLCLARVRAIPAQPSTGS